MFTVCVGTITFPLPPPPPTPIDNIAGEIITLITRLTYGYPLLELPDSVFGDPDFKIIWHHAAELLAAYVVLVLVLGVFHYLADTKK